MLGQNNGNSGNSYAEKYAISFRRGAKDAKPFFKVKKYFPEAEELNDTTKIIGTLKGVLFNPAKTITKKDGGTADIQPSFTAVVEDDIVILGEDTTSKVVYYVSVDYGAGAQMRPFLNSLLSAEVGDRVEISTYIAKKQYKVISVTNPDKQKEITFKKDGKDATAIVNVGYDWAYNKDDIPEIEFVKDGDEILKVKDAEANEFFKQKIEEKFSKKEEATESSSDEIDVENIPF